MPPHVEVDSSLDDHYIGASTNANDLASPLFFDEDATVQHTSPSCRLDRRQSDPQSLRIKEEKVEDEKTVEAPYVSKIQLIIGPESDYYKSEIEKPAVATAPMATTTTETTTQQQSTTESTAITTQQPQEVVKSNNTCSKEKRLIFLRVTNAISTKGWKVVKFIGGGGSRFVSSMGNTFGSSF